MSKVIDLTNKTIVISRTDSIGDVMLTIPMCNWLKAQFEGVRLIFLGRDYTRDIVACFPCIDEFASYDEIELLPVQARVEAMRQWNADVFIHVYPHKELAKLAKKAKIGIRVGTSHRSYHLLTCSHRINFTRKNSDLHEAQLNFELLRPFGLEEVPSYETVTNEMSTFSAPSTNEDFSSILGKKPVIAIHPKSKGSAVEWPIERYIALAQHLVAHNYRVVFTGTAKEGEQFRQLLPENEDILDLTGNYNLIDFIAFLSQIDGIVAGSTGPLHITTALGKKAVGLYINKRPMHPGRWSPLGPLASVVAPETKKPSEADILLIEPEDVLRHFVARS